MDGPVISFDVSKGESHMRAFVSSEKPFGPVRRISHNAQGFSLVEELYESLRNKTGVEPSAVYEATGVYASPLLMFLLEKGYPIYRISPLESAKMRKAQIRPTKNDSLDTGTIARVFYTRMLKRFAEEDSICQNLKEMSRELEYLTEQATAEKNRYHRLLDQCWPLFDMVLDYDSKLSINVVRSFGHPSMIRTARGVIRSFGYDPSSESDFRRDMAGKITAYSKATISGCRPDSYVVEEIKAMAEEMLRTKDRLDGLAKRMESLASGLPEYSLLLTIPQVSYRTASAVIAEIGDLSKFGSASALVAYCGTDPAVLQSGKQTGEHLGITKKGNARLRTVLYLAVTRMCMNSPESKVAKFVSNKKGSLSTKAAKIAGCNKLIRIIYAMLTNGTVYSES